MKRVSKKSKERRELDSEEGSSKSKIEGGFEKKKLKIEYFE